MKIKAKISIEYEDEEKAELSFNSLNPDNYEFVKSKKEGNKVNFDIESSSLGSFLLTVDDLIVCENMVEKVLSMQESE